MRITHFFSTATDWHRPLSPRRQSPGGHDSRPLHQPFMVCLALLWGAVCLLSSQAISAQGFITAEQLFRQLPTSIFDNTTEPLTEDNKEMLLEKGYTTNWVIIAKDADDIFMEAMSAEEGTVSIHMFRGPHGGVVVMGARTADTCAAELWEYSERMGLVPYAGPADPLVADFLPANTKLSPEITPTFRICLEGEMLEAKPLFWGDSGLIDIPGARRVLYSWNGTAFTKNSSAPLGKSNP